MICCRKQRRGDRCGLGRIGGFPRAFQSEGNQVEGLLTPQSSKNGTQVSFHQTSWKLVSFLWTEAQGQSRLFKLTVAMLHLVDVLRRFSNVLLILLCTAADPDNPANQKARSTPLGLPAAITPPINMPAPATDKAEGEDSNSNHCMHSVAMNRAWSPVPCNYNATYQHSIKYLLFNV